MKICGLKIAILLKAKHRLNAVPTKHIHFLKTNSKVVEMHIGEIKPREQP